MIKAISRFSILLTALVWLAACSAPPSITPTAPIGAVTSARTISPVTFTPLPTNTTEAQPSATIAPSATPLPARTDVPTATREPSVSAEPTIPSAPLSRITASQPLTLTTIHMLSATLGWGVGQSATDLNDHVLTTQDGGQTWRDVSPAEAIPTTADSLGKAALGFFLDAQNAWVTFYERQPTGPVQPSVWRTRDGGQTWQASAALNFGEVPPVIYSPTDLVFTDAKAGWLLAHLDAAMSHDYVAIFTTADGGETWKQTINYTDENLPMVCYKNGLAALSGTTAWVAGDCGGVMTGLYLHQTTDGGVTWPLVTLPAPAEMPEAFTSDILACGASDLLRPDPGVLKLSVTCNDLHTAKTLRWLYASADDGQTWTIASLPTPYGRLSFFDANTGWLIGADDPSFTTGGTLYSTTDGGKTWNKGRAVNWFGRLNAIDTKTAWVVAQTGDVTALVKTADGGKTWTEIKPVTGK